MQIHSYDTPITMNEAHLHQGLCDYHLCTWGKARASVSGVQIVCFHGFCVDSEKDYDCRCLKCNLTKGGLHCTGNGHISNIIYNLSPPGSCLCVSKSTMLKEDEQIWPCCECEPVLCEYVYRKKTGKD